MGRGRKKALSLLLIFISSTLDIGFWPEKNAHLKKALVEYFHIVFIKPDIILVILPVFTTETIQTRFVFVAT